MEEDKHFFFCLEGYCWGCISAGFYDPWNQSVSLYISLYVCLPNYLYGRGYLSLRQRVCLFIYLQTRVKDDEDRYSRERKRKNTIAPLHCS